MKQHNQLVRFKNSFLSDPQQREELTPIINEDMTSVIKQKIKAVIELYHRHTVQMDYNPQLAYRTITLCLITSNEKQIDLLSEMNRLFKYSFDNTLFNCVQLCHDILLMKEINEVVSEQNICLYKVRLLRSMRNCYTVMGNKKQRKKCGYTLQEYCKQALLRDKVKRNPSLYQQVLDGLIEQVKMRVAKLSKRKDYIKALEHMIVFVGVLQKSEQIITSKYQLQLMQAYWALAQLHDRLHYLAYTRKYASIALNIALRLQKEDAVQGIKLMLQKLM